MSSEHLLEGHASPVVLAPSTDVVVTSDVIEVVGPDLRTVADRLSDVFYR